MPWFLNLTPLFGNVPCCVMWLLFGLFFGGGKHHQDPYITSIGWYRRADPPKFPSLFRLARDYPILSLGGGFKDFLCSPPIWGRFPIWPIFFKGLKPPTRSPFAQKVCVKFSAFLFTKHQQIQESLCVGYHDQVTLRLFEDRSFTPA